jgi:hypothetical protein
MATNTNVAHREGKVARTIETQTAKVPSDIFLWAGLGVLAAGAILQVVKAKHIGLYVGQWAAPLLIMGLYNKVVKLEGHDGATNGRSM